MEKFLIKNTIVRAIKWHNGMVIAFNEDGMHIPQFQGNGEVCARRILDSAPTGAVFMRGDWVKQETWEVKRENW